MNKIIRIFCFHRYKVDRDTGFTIYKRCLRCGKRVIEQRTGGHQPIDKEYLSPDSSI